MESSWNLFNSSTNSSNRGQNGNCSSNSLAWNISCELGTSRFDWSSCSTNNNSFNTPTTAAAATVSAATATAAPATAHPGASGVHALMFSHEGNNAHHHHHRSSSLYAGGGGSNNYNPDPHLTCLKLGKRHYFEDATALNERHVGGGFSITKRGKTYYGGVGVGVGVGGGGGFVGPSTSVGVTVASPAVVPRCQVEGCHVALVNAKDYHKRHKVCEVHSKAPKVVVLGLEQRFCQQCSRFHAVTEFDDSKRSCRRRLAGHNERRRKSSHDSIARNSSKGRALSLLSSKNNSWISSSDLSSRCSAALRELIAENRAAILSQQLVVDRDWHWHNHALEDMNRSQSAGSYPLVTTHHQVFPEPHSWDRFSEAGAHLTLDLMQAPSTAFGFLSVREKSKEEEECSELWSSLGGAHVV
ncbi:squamosa promoter-binding-like protein 7 isoform X2 [Cornus florida]|uniref:squamosa promoter-binding-like protein 7 isoform X2 n=1 Tax=Cornus florida TaxID=4283 RepID=UPI00289F054B|nr:squamosa promoter-binding-like protein 7 isoform X2 [Cornus florida]